MWVKPQTETDKARGKSNIDGRFYELSLLVIGQCTIGEKLTGGLI